MRVMKFGGTSVGNAERIRNVAEIVKGVVATRPVVIVSAVAGVTNELLAIAKEPSQKKRLAMVTSIRKKHEEIAYELGIDTEGITPLLKELEKLAKGRQKKGAAGIDQYVSFGERLSAPLLAGTLQSMSVAAKAFPAWELGMITDDNHGHAEPLDSAHVTLKKKIEALSVVPIVTGYIGKTKKGAITTLGRGGSDYTAAVIGAALKADKIQIWKEVDGIMTTDPRLVPEARVIPELAFEEAAELAYFGAKVLHPKTILPAMKNNVPVQVLNTFKPEGAGTTIVASFAERRNKTETVEALTFKKGVTAIHIYSPEFFDGSGLMARIFSAFEKYRTSIDVVSTSVAGVSLTIDNDSHLPELVKALQKLGDVEVERGKAIVCAVGGAVNAAGVAGQMFTALGAAGINVEMISQAASGISITFVVHESDAEKSLKILHKEYIT